MDSRFRIHSLFHRLPFRIVHRIQSLYLFPMDCRLFRGGVHSLRHILPLDIVLLLHFVHTLRHRHHSVTERVHCFAASIVDDVICGFIGIAHDLHRHGNGVSLQWQCMFGDFDSIGTGA